MLCDVILPYLFLKFCQTDETLAAYAEQDRDYQITEVLGQPAAFTAALRFPGRMRFQIETPCAVLDGRITAPLPWFEAQKITFAPRPCDDSPWQTDLMKILKTVTLAEIAGDTILLSSDARVALVFRTQD
jgi:hypothetical protein